MQPGMEGMCLEICTETVLGCVCLLLGPLSLPMLLLLLLPLMLLCPWVSVGPAGAASPPDCV